MRDSHLHEKAPLGCSSFSALEQSMQDRHSLDPQLFRHEALAAQAANGQVRLFCDGQSPCRLAAAVSVAIAIALACYLCIGEYTRKIRVSGQLVPAAGAIKAVAPQDPAASSPAKSGRRRGQGRPSPLRALLGARRPRRRHRQPHRRVPLARREMLTQERQLQTQQLQQHQRMLETRRQLIEAELARVEHGDRAPTAARGSAAKTLARYKSLREQGFVSEFQLTQYENDYNDQLARRQTLERAKLDVHPRPVASEGGGGPGRRPDPAELRAERGAMASLDQGGRGAPGPQPSPSVGFAPGTVTALGRRTRPGGQRRRIAGDDHPLGKRTGSAPHGAVALHRVHRTRPTVLLRLAAFPYQKFGQAKGTVIRVEQSPIAEAGGASAAGQSAPAEPVYRIVVQLAQQSVSAYGKEQQYRAGMTLEADIRQDRRRLIDWVMDPIISFAKDRAN